LGLQEENRLFELCVKDPEARARMAAFLAHGGQTREVELQSRAYRSAPQR
jgi:hypothetical protein